MENEKLIQAITEEVMKRLMAILNKDNSLSLFHKKQALVIGDSSVSSNSNVLTEEIKYLNYDLNYPPNMKDIDNYDLIIIEKLNNLELVNLSLGMPGGEKEKIIIESMLKGKKVILLSEGIEFKNYKNTCNKSFYNMYESYEKKLMEFGVEIVSLNNLKGFLKDINSCGLNKTNTCTDLRDKKLLSEIDLRRAMVNGNKDIKISFKTLVTPLAKDFIRTNKLNVIKE